VRPEDVVINGGGVPAKVLTVEHLGVESIALLDVDSRHVHALLGARTKLRVNENVQASARPGGVLFFDRYGERIEGPAAAPAPTPASTKGKVMGQDLIRALIARCNDAIASHADELTTLDQAIGDGDHGANMVRGFSAIAAAADEIAPLPFGQALQKAGTTLVMKVGGASGPLYGSLLMAMGKAATDEPKNAAGIGAIFAAGIDAVKSRGKSDAGAKTMLEVLIPVQAALAKGGSIADIRAAADAGLASTKNMLATKGRAAFLGERSIGHLDPGARSSALLIHTICDVLEGK
jgi:dihydroxyacetone kinase-like protein